MTKNNIIITILVVLIIVGVGFLVNSFLGDSQVESDFQTNINEQPKEESKDDKEDLTTAFPEFTKVNLYFVAVDDGGQQGPLIGCNDSLVPMEIDIEPSRSPWVVAVKELIQTKALEGTVNTVGHSALEVKTINIIDGLARIRLTGDVKLAGTCDDPRFLEQLRATVMQFDLITDAEVYVNGELFTTSQQ